MAEQQRQLSHIDNLEKESGKGGGMYIHWGLMRDRWLSDGMSNRCAERRAGQVTGTGL